MVSLDPCWKKRKKLSWLNCCAAFVNWKLISTLKNEKTIFCLVMIRSFLNLVPIMRIASWTRIVQSLSILISHDLCYYLSSKKLDWLKFWLISRIERSVSAMSNNKPGSYLFSQPSVNMAEISKIWKFFFFLSWNFKGTT